MTYRIAVCDDDSLALRVLVSLIKKEFLKHNQTVQADAYQDGRCLKEKIREISYDALFLDIDLPILNGISLARFQKRISDSTAVIFISNHEEKVFESFAAEPLRFIRKKYLERELPEAITALLQKNKKPQEDQISIKTNASIRNIPVKEIMYVESFNKTQNIVLKEETIPVRYTIQYLEEQLEPYHFFKPHRCFLVNPASIFSMEKNELILDNGKSIPVSRSKQKETLEYFRKALSL